MRLALECLEGGAQRLWPLVPVELGSDLPDESRILARCGGRRA